MSAGKPRWALGYSGGGSAGMEARWAGTGDRGRDKTAASRGCVGELRRKRDQRLAWSKAARQSAKQAGSDAKKLRQLSSLRASTALGSIGATP